jgi:YD repeat-containing protein
MEPEMSKARSIFLTTAFVIISLGVSYAQLLPAGPDRPPSVPSDYVITPFGYFHPSCVREIAQGETILADGRIQYADGTEESVAPVCNFSRYNARGELISEINPSPFEIGHDWIEAGQVSTQSSSYGKITATWTVPPTPKTNHNQTLFFFPGFMDINETELIIQPVLGYNDGQSGVGPWNIASWNCCPSGTANYSTPKTVQTGDKILGTITSTCKAGDKNCSKWDITTKDVTSGKSTTLKNTPSEGQTFNWAQSGALEVYSIYECSDYPPNKFIEFSDVALYDYNFKKIADPGWTAEYWVEKGSTKPWCNYKEKNTPTTAILDY